MSQLLDENEQKTLNYLGTLVSFREIKRNKLYLIYCITDGFVDTLFFWDSNKIPNFGKNGYLKMNIGSNYNRYYSIEISLNNGKESNIIEIPSEDRSKI